MAAEATAFDERRTTGRPPWMERPSRAMQITKILVLLFLAFVMIFPFIYVIAVSFSSYQDVIGRGLILFPRHPTLEARCPGYGFARIQIAIEPRKTAAGDIQSNAMTRAEEVAGHAQVDGHLVHAAARHQLGLLPRITILAPNDALAQIHRVSVRVDVDESGHEIRVRR